SGPAPGPCQALASTQNLGYRRRDRRSSSRGRHAPPAGSVPPRAPARGRPPRTRPAAPGPPRTRLTPQSPGRWRALRVEPQVAGRLAQQPEELPRREQVEQARGAGRGGRGALERDDAAPGERDPDRPVGMEQDSGEPRELRLVAHADDDGVAWVLGEPLEQAGSC